MSQFLTITQSNSLPLGERKRTLKQKSIRLGGLERTNLFFLLVVLICILGVCYIFEVNSVATQGYKIRELERQLQELKDNQEKLKIKEAELRSMYNIEQNSKGLDMVAPKDVSYMQLPGDVAMK
jgi:cell division protein FtsL